MIATLKAIKVSFNWEYDNLKAFRSAPPPWWWNDYEWLDWNPGSETFCFQTTLSLRQLFSRCQLTGVHANPMELPQDITRTTSCDLRAAGSTRFVIPPVLSINRVIGNWGVHSMSRPLKLPVYVGREETREGAVPRWRRCPLNDPMS
jgi:hypothetical protein